MKIIKATLTFCCLLAATSTFFAQIKSLELKLQYLPVEDVWGVYVRAGNNITPSANTITGSAQVTAVMPIDFQWHGLKNISGIWTSNVIVNGPIENPNRKYVSFGLVTDQPPIQYIAGQETLLFTFKKSGICPDTLYLIDNENDPFAQLPNSFNSNPGNEFSVIDFGVPDFPIFQYSNNYAFSGWSCHPNFGNSEQKCLETKIQWQPKANRWDVLVRAVPGSLHSSNNFITEGRVTIVAPEGFAFSDLSGHIGNWLLTTVTDGPPENPGSKYLTFEKQAGTVPIELKNAVQRILFSFKPASDCPDSLYFASGLLPDSLEASTLKGYGFDNAMQPVQLNLCGSYGPGAWNCNFSKFSENEPQVQFPTQHTAPGNPDHFHIAPNPASGWTNVFYDNNKSTFPTFIQLTNLYGQVIHQEVIAEGRGILRLDLTMLPPSMYVAVLTSGGKILQSEKLVVHGQ